MKSYVAKYDLDSIVKEINELSERLKKISPEKEKKYRAVKTRYDKLRKRINNLFIINLVVIWFAIFTALSLSRIFTLYVSLSIGLTPYIPSPLMLPGISLDGSLNDLILLLAILIGYQPFHNKLTGFNKLMSIQR